ncbi:hypothetical protein PIB30_076885, partial [Stylosanthes scabra]|nr:hypothetical protein [Stylosanthes scabra]
HHCLTTFTTTTATQQHHKLKKEEKEVAELVEGRRSEKAAMECCMVEKIWKLLTETEDFMKSKKQIAIQCLDDMVTFCFQLKELMECGEDLEEMKRMVSEILEVEVDLKGGSGMVEAAMMRKRRRG